MMTIVQMMTVMVHNTIYLPLFVLVVANTEYQHEEIMYIFTLKIFLYSIDVSRVQIVPI